MRIVKQRQKKTTVYDVKQVISDVVDVYKDLILETRQLLCVSVGIYGLTDDNFMSCESFLILSDDV